MFRGSSLNVTKLILRPLGLRGLVYSNRYYRKFQRAFYFMKKSFVLYCDTYDTLQHLSDEQLGKLTRMIFEYQISGITPETNNPLFIAFSFIKSSLDRDCVKYEERAERSRENGVKGGRPKKNQVGKKETQKTQRVISEPKKPDSDSVSVSDSVNVSENDKKENRVFKSIIEIRGMTFFEKSEKVNEAFKDFLINRITNKDYPTTLAIKSLINKMKEIYKTEQEALDGIARSIEGNYKGLFESSKSTFKQPEQKVVTRASMGLKMQ